MTTREERIKGGLIGLLVGDALGVPYEFHAPQDIPPKSEIEFAPPPDFRRAHQGTPPGTWSDDGAQALCLLASLLQCGSFEAEDFGQRLLNWYEQGYLAVDNRVFDVGITTGVALQAIRAGKPALDAGPCGEQDNGNGSLMRVLPLALWHQGTDADLVADAQQQSRVTHGHLRAQVCCALYCLWARRILMGSADPWPDAVQVLRGIYTGHEEARYELDWAIRPDDHPVGNGSGYVVDCLRTARWATSCGSYEEVVRAAIARGNDTDTTACVAGGVAGLRDGASTIPERWRNNLRGREFYEPLLEGLLTQSAHF